MDYSAEIPAKTQATCSNKYFVLFLALFTVPLSGLCIDIYVPSLPAVSQYFGVDKSLVQLTLTSYMLGLGIMQLFAGGISDSFGRKKPFLIAMAAYIIATLLIPLSQEISELLVLRFIQGIMLAVVVVPMRSVVSDLFEGAEYLRMSNHMFLAWSLVLIVAPFIGGYLQHYFGWHANFYLLAFYSFISFVLVAIYMPETSVHRHAFNLLTLCKRYQDMLHNKKYLIGLLMNGLLYSLILLFAVVGPFLIQNVLHYTAVEFGRFALLAGLFWFLGGLTNRFLIHVAFAKKSKISFCIMLVLSLVSLIIDLFVPINIYTVFTPIILLLYCGGIVFPNNFARSMTLFPKTTGSANALFGSLIFLIAGSVSGLGTILKSTSEIPLALAYVVIISLCLALSFLAE